MSEQKQPFVNPSRDEIREILRASHVVAVVGLSDNPDRPSYMVSQAMQAKGYKIVPVNPVRESILGEKCYKTLSDIPFPVDIVNVFRRSEEVLPFAQAAVEIGAKTYWLQLGIHNEEAAQLALAAGLNVITDRCIKVEDAILLP